jgi:hypothetical protein
MFLPTRNAMLIPPRVEIELHFDQHLPHYPPYIHASQPDSDVWYVRYYIQDVSNQQLRRKRKIKTHPLFARLLYHSGMVVHISP